MGKFRGIRPVIISTGLLASISLLLSGIAGSPAEAANDAGRPESYVLDAQDSARPLIASPAKPVGYDAQVASQGSQADQTSYVGLIEKGGATSLRDDVFWAFVEPTQGKFSWTVPDEIVTQSAEHHLHPLLIVDTSPAWESGGSTANYWLPPRSAAAYGQFAATVAARYGPGGVFWKDHPTLPEYLPAGLELWNEENLSGSWGGEAPNPTLYAAMVKAAYPLIKKADPTMTVVLGGLSPAGGYDDVTCSGKTGTGHDASAWNGVNYLQTLYTDGIHGYFDAVGWHAYNFNTGETAAEMLAYAPCSAWSQMSATPVSARSLMTAHGDAAKKVWITESGAPTCTAGVTYNPCVTVAQQAALAAAEAKWRPLSWAGGYYWYDIRDKTTDPQQAASHFGAVYANNSPKPAYQALLKAWKAAA
jgi:polysaccharide biosynthesis protein PslG